MYKYQKHNQDKNNLINIFHDIELSLRVEKYRIEEKMNHTKLGKKHLRKMICCVVMFIIFSAIV